MKKGNTVAASIIVQGPFTQPEFDEVTRRIDVLRTQYPTVAFETTTAGADVLNVTIKVPAETATDSELQGAYDLA